LTVAGIHVAEVLYHHLILQGPIARADAV